MICRPSGPSPTFGYNSLAISPSYELARRFRTDGLSPDEVNALPKDFSEVLAVYDDLGDVQRVIFQSWWKDRALAVFGHEGTKPRVRRIDTLKKNRKKNAAERLQLFIDNEWGEQGQPNAAIVSIPLGLTRARGHSGFPLGLISDSNFQNGGLNERATVCGIGRLVAAA